MPFGTKGAGGSAMHRTVVTGALFSVGIIVGLASSEWLHAQPVPKYTTKQVIQTALENLPGQEVLIFSSEWHPGFRLPLHKHPEGHEFTFVVEGEQTFEVEGLGTKVVKAGEVIYTPSNVAHHDAMNSPRLAPSAIIQRVAWFRRRLSEAPANTNSRSS